MIAIIDYDMGNIHSVAKAIESFGGKVALIDNGKEINKYEKILLPGVGAFGHAMEELQKRDFINPLQEIINEEEKPLLGICLGLQLLFSESEEDPGIKGLQVFKEKVQSFKNKIDKKLKIPHMGWNDIHIEKKNKVFKDIKNKDSFYFVHSYFAPYNKEYTVLKCEYGIQFTAALAYKNIYAAQFHPEKSSSAGLTIIKNFVQL
ncbi:imidazole glycerol phosphate synthase subunit HisH [Candidatus Margulisiibacteriota bacterium]